MYFEPNKQINKQTNHYTITILRSKCYIYHGSPTSESHFILYTVALIHKIDILKKKKMLRYFPENKLSCHIRFSQNFHENFIRTVTYSNLNNVISTICYFINFNCLLSRNRTPLLDFIFCLFTLHTTH